MASGWGKWMDYTSKGGTTTTGDIFRVSYPGQWTDYTLSTRLDTQYTDLANQLAGNHPREKYEEKVEINLTLKEAQYLEEACEKDARLKEIMRKIEEEVDFQIVVSFRDDKSK